MWTTPDPKVPNLKTHVWFPCGPQKSVAFTVSTVDLKSRKWQIKHSDKQLILNTFGQTLKRAILLYQPIG